MIEMELSPVARRVVEDLGEVTAGEEVLVIAEAGDLAVAEALSTAARAAGATAMLQVIPRLDQHGVEPPDTVAAAMREADAVFTATEHSITHTRARIAAAEAGSRVAILRGVTPEMMVSGAMTADFAAVRERTTLVCDAVAASDEVHMAAPAGTDVRFSVADRPTFPLDGAFHDYGFSNLPPGLCVTSPVEGSARGRIVLDFSMDGFGRLEDPIELDLDGGEVTAVAGGREADRLETVLAEAGTGATNLAEFAVGTNSAARLTGALAEDKKKLGVVDVALGDNTSIGGSVESTVHLDAIVRSPTVRLDETVVLTDEEFDEAALRTIAGR